MGGSRIFCVLFSNYYKVDFAVFIEEAFYKIQMHVLVVELSCEQPQPNDS